MFGQSGWSLPVAFYFKVTFSGQQGIEDIAFQEVSGLSAELDIETQQEGGVNDAVLHLPKGIKTGRVSMKRAMLPVGSGAGASLTEWITNTLNFDDGRPIQPRDLLIHLLDAKGETLHLWECGGAYPVKWATESFESQKNAVAIINLEFACKTIKQTK